MANDHAIEDSALGSAPLYALGVVVPDIGTASRAYQHVLGIEPKDFGISEVVDPEGATVAVRMQVFFMNGFYIKLQQPLTGNGPWANHLRAHGLSVQNLQFDARGKPRVRENLMEKGGLWSLGGPTDSWSYVDFRGTLGVTLEPTLHDIEGLMAIPVTPIADDVQAVGALPVEGVGIAVHDVATSALAWKEILGSIELSTALIEGLRFPLGSGFDEGARVERAVWKQGAMAIELIGSGDGATPWSAHVRNQCGDAGHFVSFDAAGQLDTVLADLIARGGRWMGGEPGRWALVDFTAALGLAIRVSGASAQ